MATFTSQIFEILTLNGDDVGSSVVNTINNINYVDNRILNVPANAITTIFKLDGVPGAGTFVTSSVKYARITNNSATAPLKLITTSTSASFEFLIATGSSFMLSSYNAGPSTVAGDFNLESITNISVEPSGSSANIEYYIVTT